MERIKAIAPMISLRQRVMLLTVTLTGVLLTTVYSVTACPAQGGGPATPPPLPPSAPACIDTACPPWAGNLLPLG